jgi:hypothetical protein
LIGECEKLLTKYLNVRNEHSKGKIYESETSPMDYLSGCIKFCATAVKFDRKNHELQFKLASLLEEKHYLIEAFGFKNVSLMI